MQKNEKIFVAGHRGLVGSAITRELKNKGYTNIITRTHNELDLTNNHAVELFFEEQKPDYVILSAAKVGGIHGNNTFPVEFFTENMKIQLNVIENSFKTMLKNYCFSAQAAFIRKMRRSR